MRNLKDRWPVYLANLIRFLLLAYFVILVVSIFFWDNTSVGISYTTPPHDINVPYAIYPDPDSLYKQHLEDLSYREYRSKTDSMDRLKNHYSVPFGGSMRAGPMGVATIRECDICRFADPRFSYYDMGEEKYYLFISGFKMPRRYDDNLYPRLYYKKGGISYLKYMRFDSFPGADRKMVYEGRWVNKVIKYRVEDELQGANGTKRLLIPISKTTYTILEVFCWGWLIAGVLLFLSVARSFIRVLTDIANGKAFTIRNYQRLFYITNVVVLVPTVCLIIQLILQWVFHSYYAGDLLININWGDGFVSALVGLVLFLLAHAFQKGNRIQQEQDLTI